jgi:hypothetical protein
MKNILNIKNLFAIAILSIALTGCKKWTEQAPLNYTVENTMESPEYLANLRAYKTSNHTIVMGTFDNSIKNYKSVGDHLKNVPDSIDYLSVMHPDNLTDTEVSEINYLKNDKGTKVLFTINYQDGVTEVNKQITTAGASAKPFDEYMSEYLKNKLNLLSKYNYDGVILNYVALAPDFLSAADLNILKSRQTALFTAIADFKSKNTGKLLLLSGTPENVINKTYLDDYKYFILNTQAEKYIYDISLKVEALKTAGIAANKLIITAGTYDFGEDPTIGTITDLTGVSTNAIVALAYWNSIGSKKAGLHIYNIGKDYFSATRVYNNTIKAINILNPSPVK